MNYLQWYAAMLQLVAACTAGGMDASMSEPAADGSVTLRCGNSTQVMSPVPNAGFSRRMRVNVKLLEGDEPQRWAPDPRYYGDSLR